MDGFTAAWLRIPMILFSNSVLLKQISGVVSWFQHELIPNVHYVPIMFNLQDIVSKI